MIKTHRNMILSLTLLLAGHAGHAEQAAQRGAYTIHYNALPTEMLSPEVAKSYGIVRSRNRALLNVSILKQAGATSEPTKAAVKATAANLSAQLRTIDVRELLDQGAIYYIGEFPITDGETLKFTLAIKPEGQDQSYDVHFEQQFFTH